MIDISILARFQRLIPSTPTIYGTVTTHNGDGATSRVTLPTGAVIVVRGQGVAVSSPCWVRDGAVIGIAPSLPSFSVDV